MCFSSTLCKLSDRLYTFKVLPYKVFLCVFLTSTSCIRKIYTLTNYYIIKSYISGHRGAAVITTTQLHSKKSKLRFCKGSNPIRGMSEIYDDENL